MFYYFSTLFIRQTPHSSNDRIEAPLGFHSKCNILENFLGSGATSKTAVVFSTCKNKFLPRASKH